MKYNTFLTNNLLLLACLGLLMGRAEIAGFFPLSLIYWSIITGVNGIHNFTGVMVTLTTGIGLIWSGNFQNVFYLLAGLVGFIIYYLFYQKKEGDRALIISLVYICFSLFINYFGHVLLYRYFLSLGEAMIIYILIKIGQEGMEQLLNQKKNLTRFALVTLFIITSGALIGLANLAIIPGLALNVFLLLLIIGVTHTISFLYGIVTVVLFGLVLVSADLIPLLSMIKYIITAFTCGLFQKKNKLWIFAGVILAFLIYSGFSPSIYDLKAVIIELLIAGTLFLLIPGRLWEYLFAGLNEKSIILDKEPNGNLNRSLLELARVFDELSITFEDVLPVEKEKRRTRDFIYIFRNKICQHCHRVKICWQQERRDTYQRLSSLLREGEERGSLDGNLIQKFLGDKCIYSGQITAAARATFELYQLNRFWRDRLNAKQKIVSEQLAGISDIIQQFSHSTKLTLQNNLSLGNIKERALKGGIDIYDIELDSNLNPSGLNLAVKMEPCSGNNPCQDQVIKLLNHEYQANFRILKKKCGNILKDESCQLLYGTVGPYRLNLFFVQKALSGNISGDALLNKPLRDGKDLIVLSDGMGVGKKAAQESKAAINLLEKIIDAGFDQELAVKTINSALYLRSQDENFTTLDIAIFNTFTGEITFSKIGAVASYIKRDWELIEVDTSSLPVGILDNIEISSRSYQLQVNDFVIMVTDGILEARPDMDWFKQLLQTSSFDQPGELADYVFEVISNDKEVIKDDMTIVVFKIEEISQKRRKFKV
jgi:stage II sporulation protein E